VSVIYCKRCDAEHDSDFVDCIEDPANTEKLFDMVCWESLTEAEQEAVEGNDCCLD